MKDSKSILDMKKEATGQNKNNGANAGDLAKSSGGFSLYMLVIVSILAFGLG